MPDEKKLKPPEAGPDARRADRGSLVGEPITGYN